MSSKAATERNQRILLELTRLPGNDRCADCRAPNPRWASWNLGIFLCMQCAGVHRKMGTHISKVRSITLDTWTREQVEAMKGGGNAKSNAVYNPDEMRNRPPTNTEQSERGSEIEKYIRKKYEFKKFMDRGPPPVPQKDPPSLRRQTSSLASPRTSNGRSPTMPSPSPSMDSAFGNSTPSSSRLAPPSPGGASTGASASSSRSLAVPPRSSSALSASSSSASAAHGKAESTISKNDNLLIPDIDSIPTQPSPSPTIALFAPHSQAQQMNGYASQVAVSSPSFMDSFSVAAAAAAGTPPQAMGLAHTPSPSLSPFGGGMALQQQQHQQQQQAFGLGVGLSPMNAGAMPSPGYSPVPSPSISGYGAMNPFQQQQLQMQQQQQQQQQHQQLLQQQQQQQQQQQAMMGAFGSSQFGATSLAMPYGGYPAVTSPTGSVGSGGLGAPFNPFFPSSPSGGSPAPYAQHQQQQYHQQHQPQQQQQYAGQGGLQPQPTGFNAFANGMMPAHLRQQQPF